MTTPIIATTGPVVTPVVRWPDAYGFQFVYDGTFAVQAYRTAQERDTGMAFQLDHGRTVRPFLIPGESDPHPHAEEVLAFLRRSADGKHRIVSSGDLTTLQIADAQAQGRFYVEPGGGLGWALLPWELRAPKDAKRVETASTRTPKHADLLRRAADALAIAVESYSQYGITHEQLCATGGFCESGACEGTALHGRMIKGFNTLAAELRAAAGEGSTQ